MGNPTPPLLEVELSEDAARYARPHVGADGAKWRQAMRETLPASMRAALEERGPRLRGTLLTLDPTLYEDAAAALEVIAFASARRAAIARADLAPLEDALVAAMAERRAEEKRRGGGRA